MPIALLPPATSRAIGCSLVLNDATSVVKELVENAIDAKATVISVEISANTVDVIQVKDNGFGIGTEDRQLLCRRGCTSKIRTTEDLAALGGSSLGFRGEALASVAELSEAVTITTRVDGETAGSLLKYGKAGALVSSGSASHPVGTTVRVQEFLKLIPVRRQSALKATSKTLLAIKKLLQVYAFARPSVKLSLKVLKGKNDRVNWSYEGQCRAEDIRRAAIRVLGPEISARCEFRSIGPSDTDVDANSLNQNYSMLALLCKVEQDLDPVSNVGHFVSIDGRPVTTSRGLTKDLIKQYRNMFRYAYSHQYGTTTTADPFICLHIRCPAQAYDVNVEPAKDEVLFSDASVVTSLAERLFKDYYGAFDKPDEKSKMNPSKSSKPAFHKGFDLFLARRCSLESDADFNEQPPDESNEKDVTGAVYVDARPPLAAETQAKQGSFVAAGSLQSRGREAEHLIARSPKVCSNTNTNEAEESHHIDGDILGLQGVVSHLKDHDLRLISVTNPWSLARMNATSRLTAFTTRSDDGESATAQLLSPRSPDESSPCRRLPHQIPLVVGTTLSTPGNSPHPPAGYQNPGPPLRPWRPSARSEDMEEGQRSENLIAQVTPSNARGTLLPWAKPGTATTQPPSSRRPSDQYDRGRRSSQSSGASSPESGLPSQVISPQSSAEEDHQVAQPRRLPKITQPFLSPVKGLDSWTRGSASPVETTTPTRGCIVLPQALAASAGGPRESTDTELAEIMDFEHRKKVVIAQQRKLKPPSLKHVINTARLAEIQRASNHASSDIDNDLAVYHTMSLPGHIARHGNVNEDSETRLGDNFDTQRPKSTSNPHRNRYLAATKYLSSACLNVNSRPPPADDDDMIPTENPLSRMPESDPRAYLIKHIQQQTPPDGQGLSKSGLKIRRAKSTRLPLESIPVDAEVHDLVAVGTSDILHDAGMLEHNYLDLQQSDKYLQSGDNEFVEWILSRQVVQRWEYRVRELVRNNYRARLGDEEAVPDVEVNLARAVKVHIDG